MPLDPKAANGPYGPPREIAWDSTKSLLYALSVGAGVTDPTGFELDFTTENSKGVSQKALPTQLIVLGEGHIPPYGTFDRTFELHGEQHFTLHRPLSVKGQAVARTRIAELVDKGKDAVAYIETSVTDPEGRPWWTATRVSFMRREGGFGGHRGTSSAWRRPDRPADAVASFTTRADQALLYRLNEDRNPLHSDPAFAQAAGYGKPILHGKCTFGITGRLLLHAVCGSDPMRLRSMGGQFRSPVVPGETVTVHAWMDGEDVLFQTRVGDRVVLDRGVLKRSGGDGGDGPPSRL